MKTKVIILAALISVVTLTVANTQSQKTSKTAVKSESAKPAVRESKGYAMEDSNQF